MTQFIIQSWEESYDATLWLFEKMSKDKFVPDIILGVARGGWIPGRLLADFFKMKSTANIKVEFYHKIGETNDKPLITQEPGIDLSGKSVLVVDDVADTGKSLRVTIDLLIKEGAKEIKSATLFYKPQSEVKPEYYSKETSAWVVFPWERFEFIEEMISSQPDKKLDEIKFDLKELGVPPGVIEIYLEHYSQ